MKITQQTKDLIQNWWRNQKLFWQSKVKRNQYHQTSFTTKVKGTYLHSQEIKEKKKIYKNKHQTIKKMSMEHIYQ